MCSRSRIREAVLLASALAALGACGRHDQTSVAQAPPDHPSTEGTPVSPQFPGGGSPPPPSPIDAKYDGNAQAIAEGRRLFDWYNCSGCHFHGAGGIGPSLIDDKWTYGGEMDQIYATIYQGRPNGMPSWGQKLSTTEIWELVAYIRDAAKQAKDEPIPTTPTEATPADAARNLDAPSPAVVDFQPPALKADAGATKP
jgi:cytochrome c oxidase cbb3-type subunit 3